MVSWRPVMLVVMPKLNKTSQFLYSLNTVYTVCYGDDILEGLMQNIVFQSISFSIKMECWLTMPHINWVTGQLPRTGPRRYCTVTQGDGHVEFRLDWHS